MQSLTHPSRPWAPPGHALGLMGSFSVANSLLYDIPPHKEEKTTQFSAAKNLCIDDLSDIAAHKMTHFFQGNLKELYEAFGLESELQHYITGA